MNIAVTTVLKPDADSLRRAREKAEDLRTAFYEREKNLFHMSEKYGEEGFLVYGKKPVFFWSKEGTYRFHLGTAVLRILKCEKGMETGCAIFCRETVHLYWTVPLDRAGILSF